MAKNKMLDESAIFEFANLKDMGKKTVLEETDLKKTEIKKEESAEKNETDRTEEKTEKKTENKKVESAENIGDVKTESKNVPVFSAEKEEQMINSKIREIDVLSFTGEKLGTTRGRKGKKLPQISFRFSEVNDQYIRYISRIEGMSITQYINYLIDKDRNEKMKNQTQN